MQVNPKMGFSSQFAFAVKLSLVLGLFQLGMEIACAGVIL